MKRSILKKSSSLHVSYNDGDYTNNLRGAAFELERKEHLWILYIDLSSNLAVQNKQTNTYHDIVDLIYKQREIKLIQVLEVTVSEVVEKACDATPEFGWQVILNVGERDCFTYKVKPRCRARSLFLDVVNS